MDLLMLLYNLKQEKGNKSQNYYCFLHLWSKMSSINLEGSFVKQQIYWHGKSYSVEGSLMEPVI